MRKVLMATAAAVMMIPASAMAERDGLTVYNTSCAMCHAAGVANAPKVGDAAAWNARLEQGMDALYNNADKGKGQMPARGLCMDCTDGELKAAIQYMVDNSK